MTQWIGETPAKCNLCKSAITDTFIDGRLRGGLSWAFMCTECHSKYGVGLGIGNGQQYDVKGEQQ